MAEFEEDPVYGFKNENEGKMVLMMRRFTKPGTKYCRGDYHKVDTDICCFNFSLSFMKSSLLIFPCFQPSKVILYLVWNQKWYPAS